MVNVRCAIPLDAPSMARFLNEIIKEGGTTAMTQQVAGKDIADLMNENDGQSAWHVALNDSEEVVGFQWIAPADYLAVEAAEIATFVQIGQTGLGIGSKLFDATRAAAKTIGYKWINANIRADNEGGLIYYQSRGFIDYARLDGYRLENGQSVDKILKRFDI